MSASGTISILLQDPEFWASVWRGAVYSISTIVLQIVLGVAAALVLNEMFPGRNILRAIVIFPYVVPTVVAVILWKWLLNSQFGLINYLLEERRPRRPADQLDGQATGSWSRSSSSASGSSSRSW